MLVMCTYDLWTPWLWDVAKTWVRDESHWLKYDKFLLTDDFNSDPTEESVKCKVWKT